jgi:hypothetical protein
MHSEEKIISLLLSRVEMLESVDQKRPFMNLIGCEEILGSVV